MFCKKFLVLATLALSSTPTFAQTQLTVQANKPITNVPPNMWGIFFEDINFAADGGLYAELVKNRSFEFFTPLMGWKEVKQNKDTGHILIVNRTAVNTANPRYAAIMVDAPNGSYGLSNEGFRGMGITKGQQYNFSMWANAPAGTGLQARVVLLDEKDQPIGEAALSGFHDGWQPYKVSLTATGTAAKGKLQLLFKGQGSIDLDMVSLFPANTWKNRPNGLRADLAQMLADLKPGFIRFPGGCIVEGRDLANRYQWKKTVGKPEERTLIVNRWNTEFSHRSTPDYFQSFGLGFFEYFQLAEDIGAAPLPILNCGMACQFNTGEVVAMNELDPYVQDALDLIEFANGDANTKWGALRAAMGHPGPFHLTLMGVGNEQWDPQYIERYKIFEQAIKSKYPDIKLVSSAGPFSKGPMFDYLWKELKSSRADFIDEHYYMPPQWFLSNASRYDNYDRKKGPKIFAGEYAAHTKEGTEPESRNTWGSALAEAAFMTGLERNADVVQMASYAPLFAHVEAWQWRPDLIWFDNLRAVGTPNYYVQKLFSANKGTQVVPILQNGAVLAGKDSLYASATIDAAAKQVILKIVNVSAHAQSLQINLQGVQAAKGAARQQVLTANTLAINTLDDPGKVVPVTQPLTAGNHLAINAAPASLNVIAIPYK
ncbi:alpha-L-arabinofuranosidase C-terminal domain-containing protein [Chitinophaga sp. GbtcB8]|uniref:alpha-L-arabinofuranosidase C-terminal domain-containing protein n=1 Tax=Chitinophaga sp. GbtcB8 TaxID=2824753 RepID=UPI001C2FBE6A|nr:alpha-L-arabinofuranosidase C-terminal domain-containing protein [Chitinophaga sp. GbtcB8]